MASTLLHNFPLPDRAGWQPARLVVWDHGTHLTEAREYNQYGVWTPSCFSCPSNVEMALARLLDQAQYEQAAEVEAQIMDAITALQPPHTHHRVDEQWRDPSEDSRAGCL